MRIELEADWRCWFGAADDVLIVSPCVLNISLPCMEIAMCITCLCLLRCLSIVCMSWREEYKGSPSHVSFHSVNATDCLFMRESCANVCALYFARMCWKVAFPTWYTIKYSCCWSHLCSCTLFIFILGPSFANSGTVVKPKTWKGDQSEAFSQV